MDKSQLNIKFEISKVDDGFRYNLIYVSSKFRKKLLSNVIRIDFKTKKIVKDSKWPNAYINDDKITIRFSDSTKSYIDTNQKNAYLEHRLIPGENIIKTDIKNFDLILIKALKILSDTINNEIS